MWRRPAAVRWLRVGALLTRRAAAPARVPPTLATSHDALFPPSSHLRRCSAAAREDDDGVLSLLDDIPDIFPREKATRMRRRIPPRRPPEYDEEDATEVEEEKVEPMTLSYTDPPDDDDGESEETEWELINFNTAEMERKMKEEMMEENEKATK